MTVWRMHAGWQRWVGAGVAGVLVLLIGGFGLRGYLHVLARRSVPLPPPDFAAMQESPISSSLSGVMPRDAWVGDWRETAEREALHRAHALLALHAASPDAIAGEYILFFRDAFARERLLALARQHGVRVLDQHDRTLRVRVADRGRLAAMLAALPGEVEIEANFRMRIPLLDETGDALPAPSTPYRGFGDQALAWLGVPEPGVEWGRGVRIAVLDTGVSGVPVVQRTNLLESDARGEHGALVAAILHKILPGAALLDVQVMASDGTGDAYTVAKGIREAVDAGADIINLSVGTRGSSRVLADAVQYALAQGVLLVASAGNEGVERVSYPAAYEGVLSVAAVDAEEQHLHFSNRGEGVDLAAPGVGVRVGLENQESVSFSGTSAAAPFVAASAGLALSQNPSLDLASLRNMLLETANDTGEPGVNDLTGRGIVSPQRVQEYHQPGIVDVAVLRPHFHVNEAGMVTSVEVAAQNRGTADLDAAEMVVSVNEREYRVSFERIVRGRTMAYTIDLGQPDGFDDIVDVSVRVHMPDDVRPENNELRSVWMPMTP